MSETWSCTMPEVRTAGSWDARARRKLQSVGAEAFGTHQVERTAAVLRSDQCFIPLSLNLTFSYIRPWTILRFYNALHCAACPLAVQTSPYFLFNSFASRKSDSNTSPRKHKYASAGAAFYIVPVIHLSSLSEEKFGPQSGLSRKHK